MYYYSCGLIKTAFIFKKIGFIRSGFILVKEVCGEGI
jgi:hypothetical protein